jgi:integrase
VIQSRHAKATAGGSDKGKRFGSAKEARQEGRRDGQFFDSTGYPRIPEKEFLTMQDGTIRKHHGSWTLFYYDTVIRKGVKQRVRLSKKLAAVSPEYPTEAKVRPLADGILDPINRKQVMPESSLSITEYIEQHYFPGVETELRPSTLHNYKISIFEKHLKSRLQDQKVRDARPVHFQRLMREIKGVGHVTLLHIKNFLSGVFRFANREGHYEGANPLADVTVPGRPKKFNGVAYTISEFERMIDDLQQSLDNLPPGQQPETGNVQLACEVIGLMFLTGLRQSEARGLRWSDWNEQSMTLTIQRSVWNSKLGPTKNPDSEGCIPVLPSLKELLEARRARVKPRPDAYVFAGSKRQAPLNFHNLENRVIKPALKARQLADKNHDRLPGSGVTWRGWHGFRRGLASNLFDLGIHPKLIAAILRHGDVATTMKYYIQDRGTETRAALDKFELIIKNRPSGGLLVNGIDPTKQGQPDDQKDAQNGSQKK